MKKYRAIAVLVSVILTAPLLMGLGGSPPLRDSRFFVSSVTIEGPRTIANSGNANYTVTATIQRDGIALNEEIVGTQGPPPPRIRPSIYAGNTQLTFSEVNIQPNSNTVTAMGYRKALDLIHTKHKSLQITPEMIKELHRLCRGESWDAGKWKEKDNDIIRKHPDGRVEVIFRPVRAAKTPGMMKQLCLFYEHSISQLKYPDLYAVACLVLDFLSIHPFRDGNGRVSRLLTLLALYQHGFMVGKYISLERIVEQSKETYYEALNKSSQKWHEAKHDLIPWFNYFLGAILSAYKEFEERAVNIKPGRGAKTQIVTQAIERQVGEFSLGGIERECPAVSRDMIKIIFRELQKTRKIECLGKGKSAKWKNT